MIDPEAWDAIQANARILGLRVGVGLADQVQTGDLREGVGCPLASGHMDDVAGLVNLGLRPAEQLRVLGAGADDADARWDLECPDGLGLPRRDPHGAGPIERVDGDLDVGNRRTGRGDLRGMGD